MQCPRCGRDNPQTDSRCSSCGYEFPTPEAEGETTPASSPETDDTAESDESATTAEQTETGTAPASDSETGEATDTVDSETGTAGSDESATDAGQAEEAEEAPSSGTDETDDAEETATETDEDDATEEASSPETDAADDTEEASSPETDAADDAEETSTAESDESATAAEQTEESDSSVAARVARIREQVSPGRGVKLGVSTYVVSLLATFALLYARGVIITGGELPEQLTNYTMRAGLYFYSAHNAMIEYTATGIAGAPNNYITLTTDYATGLVGLSGSELLTFGFNVKLFYIVVPVFLIAGGYRLARGAREDDPSPVADGINGALLVAGYLPLAVIGSFVFELSQNGSSVTPELNSAVLIVGLLYPIGFGAVGGTTAYLLERFSFRLRPGIAYGVVAFALGLLGTYALTAISVDTGPGTVTTAVHALATYGYAIDFTLPTAIDYAVPSVLFWLVVVGSPLAIGAVLGRGRSTSFPGALATGASLCLGFSIGTFVLLYGLLLPWAPEAILVFEDESITEVVRVFLYAGVLYPAVSGTLGAGVGYFT